MELSIDAQRVRRRLRIVRWVALADAVLLVALVSASLSGNRQLVSVLGPLHGGNFLLLLVLSGTGAVDGLWPWWFPALVFVTAGPPGALLGDWLIERRLTSPAGGMARAPGATGPARAGGPDAATEHAPSGAVERETELREPR